VRYGTTNTKYLGIVAQAWSNLNTPFNYPHDIRKAIYIMNAIESLNSVIGKAIKNRKLFPNDDSAKKLFI